jgi:DNA-directed RNA polymerase specialized sigma24 family protein
MSVSHSNPTTPGSGPTQAQRDALERAGAAATKGDAVGMLEALHQSHLMDGLVGRIAAKWNGLTGDDAQDIVAESVTALYQKVREGGRVKHVGAYLYRATWGRACDLHASRKDAAVTDPAILVRQSDELLARESQRAANRPDPGLDPMEAVPRALVAARRLLPQLGQENLRGVMAYIFDAIEAGREEVPNVEIADALALHPDTVRQSRLRGFQRLTRLAKDDRLVREDFSVLSAEDPEDIADDGD